MSIIPMLLKEMEQEAQKPEKYDFAAQPYEPANVNITTELLELFERSLTGGKANLAKATEMTKEVRSTK